MTRTATYLLILLGAPLGFAASYFMQPVIFRMLFGLGEYLAAAPRVLALDGATRTDNTARIALTAWAGVGIGVALMAVFSFVMSNRSRNADKREAPLPLQ